MDKIIETLGVLDVDYNDGIKALNEIIGEENIHKNINTNIQNIKSYFQTIMTDHGVTENEIFDALDEFAFNKIIDELDEISIDYFFDLISYNRWKKYVGGEYKKIILRCVHQNNQMELGNICYEDFDKLIILQKWLELFGSGGNLELDIVSIHEENDVEIQGYINFVKQTVLNEDNKDALINYYQHNNGVLLIRGDKIHFLLSENKLIEKDKEKLGECYMEEKLDYVFLPHGNKDFIELCINILNDSTINKEKNIEVFYIYVMEPEKYEYIEFINSKGNYKINSLDHFGAMFKELYNFLKDQDDLVVRLG